MKEAMPMMLMKVSMERCCEGLTVKGRDKWGGVPRGAYKKRPLA